MELSTNCVSNCAIHKARTKRLVQIAYIENVFLIIKIHKVNYLISYFLAEIHN